MSGGNPLVASASPAPVDRWAGVWIVEDIEQLAQGVRDGSWISGGLAAVGAGLDALAFVSDPIGALSQYGVAWIIEHVRPLSEALDWLAGDPAIIAAHAETWRNVARTVLEGASDLQRAVRTDVAEWQGTAGDAYRCWAGQQQSAIAGLASAAETMAVITEAAGVLIAGVRVLVRDAIAALVSRLVVYAAEEAGSLGFATPLVVEQVTTLVASWAGRIARWLKELLTSLRSLKGLAGRLGELIEALKKILARMRDPFSPGPRHGGGEPPRRPVTGPAATKPIGPPHHRHDLNKITGSSRVKGTNTVILPGTDVAKDLDDIRAGRAEWNGSRNCYEVNGRSYGVEPNGTVFPIDGAGFVPLSRSAYKVLKQCIVSAGDLDAARETLRRDPSVTPDDWRAALDVFKYHKSYRGGA